MGQLTDTVESLCNERITELNAGYGLLTGISGLTIFRAYAMSHSTNVCPTTSIQDTFDVAFDKFLATRSHNTSLCYGLGGYLWHLNELLRMDIISSNNDILEIIQFTRKQILIDIENDIVNHNIDFLSGALGKVIALFPFADDELPTLSAFVSYLFECIIVAPTSLASLTYQDGYILRTGRHVNLGLAHGVPGILKFCTMCKQNNLHNSEIKAIACVCFDFFLKNVNEDTADCFFPSIIQIDQVEKREKSRLGWCYGDLSLGYILLRSALEFKNEPAQLLAERMLIKCANRRSMQDCSVVDAGICHGSSGIAHLFHKVWLTTGDLFFYDAASYWIQKTLEMAVVDEGKITYKVYKSNQNSYQKDSSLLEGTAGIGLVLNSWDNGDCSWDSCLLLN